MWIKILIWKEAKGWTIHINKDNRKGRKPKKLESQKLRKYGNCKEEKKQPQKWVCEKRGEKTKKKKNSKQQKK